jgi:hypothetical protein
MSSRDSIYSATLVSIEHNGYSRGGGLAQRGANRYRVTWRIEDGTEGSANTRGYVDTYLPDLTPGDRVTLIRDGRGSIVHFERNP